MLILAGITIAMVLGNNGIINKAKQAKDQTENASIEENTTMLGYEAFLSQYGSGSTIQDGQGGTVQNNFLTNTISNFTPTVAENNGTYVTVSIPEVTSTTKVIGYIGLVNGKATGCTSQNNYTFYNLSPNTKYNLQIIALDENVHGKFSQQIETTTSSKLYLYNRGNEYTAITGGWYMKNIEPNGQTKKNDDNMQLYCLERGSSLSGCSPNKTIDISKFTKLVVVYKKTAISSGDAMNFIGSAPTFAYGTEHYSPNTALGEYTDSFTYNNHNGNICVYNWDSNDNIYEVYAE